MRLLSFFKILFSSSRNKVLFGAGLFILVVGGFVLKGVLFAPPPVARAFKPVTVEVEPARVASIARTITAVGTLRANQSVVVKPLVNGQVSKIYVEGGQEVKAGDPILTLDDRKYQNKLKEAEARLSFADLEFERYQKLVAQNFGRKKSHEQAISNKKEAEALVDIAKKEIEDCVIKAPFEGVVSLNDISVGASVNENTELFTVVDIDPIKIDFRVPAQYLKNISKGQTVNVTIDSFMDQKFEASVDAIDALVDPQSHTISVRATIDNKNNLLKSGLFARLDLEVGAKDNAIIVPSFAVQVNGDEEFVYKLIYYAEKNIFVAVRNPVMTGLQEGDKIEIVQGLNEGDLIVTVGQIKIRDGIPVTFEGEKEYLDKFKQKEQENDDAAGKAT